MLFKLFNITLQNIIDSSVIQSCFRQKKKNHKSLELIGLTMSFYDNQLTYSNL